MIARNSVKVLAAESLEDIVITPEVQRVTQRVLDYLGCGCAVNLSGPAGAGKTTIALWAAKKRNHPVVFLNGNDQLYSTDLVGGPRGYYHRRVVDEYIRSVTKVEEEVSEQWLDSWLLVACQNGYTLVYDEFTRSRPEANNPLLSVLEERLLVLPVSRGRESVVKVHPEFAAIFTSNPQEYAGVFRAQDALFDRMVSIALNHYDEATEVSIVKGRTGLATKDAETIVRLVRAIRQKREVKPPPSLRAALVIAKILKLTKGSANPANPLFIETCIDVLNPFGASRRQMADYVNLWFKEAGK